MKVLAKSWLALVKNIFDWRRWPVSLIVSIPIAALLLVHLESHIMYRRVELGMSIETVSQKFGKPDRTESTMLFCDKIFHWSGECPRQSLQQYQFFRTGIDRWVVIGFDAQALVRFKSMGSL